jgi:hypothetical protein
MEKKSNPMEGDQLQLANKKCLLRLLSFLDSKLPESCAVSKRLIICFSLILK